MTLSLLRSQSKTLSLCRLPRPTNQRCCREQRDKPRLLADLISHRTFSLRYSVIYNLLSAELPQPDRFSKQAIGRHPSCIPSFERGPTDRTLKARDFARWRHRLGALVDCAAGAGAMIGFDHL
jgi:hypothetical protein